MQNIISIICTISLLSLFKLSVAAPSDSLLAEIGRAKHDTTRVQLYLELGDMYEFKNADTALFYYNQALNLAKEQSEKTKNHAFTSLYARSLSYIGLLYKDYGKPDSAIARFDASMKIFTDLLSGANPLQKKNYKTGIANAYQYIGLTWQDVGENKKAIGFLQKELDVRKELNDLNGLSACYLNIGGNYKDIGDYKNAVELYNKTIEISTEINDKFQICIAYNNLSLIYKKNGDYVKALDYLQQSVKNYDILINSDPGGSKTGKYKYYKAMNISNIGLIYYSLKNYDLALKYLQDAIPVYEEIKNKKALAYSYNNIGNIYNDLGKYDEALQYFKKSLTLKEEIGDSRGIASSLENIGHVHEAMQNYSDALLYYEKSLSIKYSIEDKEGIAYTLQDISVIDIKLNRPQKAVENAEKGLAIAEELNSLEIKNSAYQNLSEAWEAMKNTDMALKYYKLYAQTKDSIFSTEKNKQLTEMETKYQTEKKDKEIIAQKAELTQKEAEIERKNHTRNILIIGILLIVVLFSILYWSRVSISKKNEAIKVRNAVIEGEKNERSRISRELHDALGSELSAVKIMLSNCLKENGFDTTTFNKGLTKLDETHQTVRRISRNILPRVLEESGLANALADLFDDYRSSGKINIKFQSFGLQQRLDEMIEFNIYRIIQEIMQNVVKHSMASEVLVELNENKNDLKLIVEDNGKGFDTGLAEKKGGSGLRNIKSRVSLINGKTNIESNLNIGTTYEIQIPLSA